MSSVVNEEKEKSKTQPNLVVSSKENGDARKQEDISFISSILQKEMNKQDFFSSYKT